GFNLASSNFVFRMVNREKIVYCSSYLNVINGFVVFIGSIIGGYIASRGILLLNPILVVFIVSFIGRLLTYFIFLPKVKEEKGFFSYRKQNLLIPLFNIPRSFFNNAEQFSITLIKKIKDHLRVSKTF
ncbi:MAG: hypothetical protein QXX68_00495, partial [Candidatus Pacearchaeota archaeon]